MVDLRAAHDNVPSTSEAVKSSQEENPSMTPRDMEPGSLVEHKDSFSDAEIMALVARVAGPASTMPAAASAECHPQWPHSSCFPAPRVDPALLRLQNNDGLIISNYPALYSDNVNSALGAADALIALNSSQGLAHAGDGRNSSSHQNTVSRATLQPSRGQYGIGLHTPNSANISQGQDTSFCRTLSTNECGSLEQPFQQRAYTARQLTFPDMQVTDSYPDGDSTHPEV